MGHKYTELTFTQAVQQVQRQMGSRKGYEKWNEGPDFAHRLSNTEAEFIALRDSFYMASVSETGWPYVQHRGGPTGFLRVLDEKTLGFADFSGNRQYISVGNFQTNDRVALFLMDYPNKRRLKVLGRIRQIPADDIESLVKLEDPRYRARVERGFYIDIEAFDWNCPQHITPRYSQEQVSEILAPLQSELADLRQRVADSVSAIRDSQQVAPLGQGPLALTITSIRQLTPRVRAYELRDLNGAPLPQISAGSHLQVPVQILPNQVEYRHYSICSNPARHDMYEIAVLLEPEGQGGSMAAHRDYQLGTVLNCEYPDNYFQLQTHPHTVLIAAGIGITPIKAMAQQLQSKGQSFELHYAGRNAREMAFSERLKRQLGAQITLYDGSRNQRLDLHQVLKSMSPSAHVYGCGPGRLLDALQHAAGQQKISSDRIHIEQFHVSRQAGDKSVQLHLRLSEKTISIDEKTSLLNGLQQAGVEVASGCNSGNCKTCVIRVLDGDVDHRDSVLTESERDKRLMCPCVSRAHSDHLVLDL